jgi:uncharacterized protein (TIGR02270 family)
MNGESYRAREWGFTELRVLRNPHPRLEVFHPADCLGDVGAASGTLLIGLAAMALSENPSRHNFLVFASSESGERGAVILSAPGEPLKDRTRISLGIPVLHNIDHDLLSPFTQTTLGDRQTNVEEGEDTEPMPIEELLHIAQVAEIPDEVEGRGKQEGQDFEQVKSPPRAVRLTSEEFALGIHEEHLEEIGSLYLQRNYLLTDPEIAWKDLGNFEQRLLNHVDAIAIGGTQALRRVQELLASSDEAEIFAASLALGSISGHDTIDVIVQAMIAASDEIIPSYVDALKHAPHPEITHQMGALLSHERTKIRAAAMKVLGYRREGNPPGIHRLLEEDESEVVAAAAEAFGRLQDINAIPLLERLLLHADMSVQPSIILALLQLGSPKALEQCRMLCQRGYHTEAKISFFLALSGKAADLSLLLQSSPEHNINQSVLEAVGILGNVQGVPTLLRILASEEDSLRLAAANSLQLITGAGLVETATIVEDADEEEPLDLTTYEIERVSTCAEEWSNWWRDHESHFDSRTRWRLGKPFDFGLCIQELCDEQSEFTARQRANLELVIRSGNDVSFEPDWFVPQQQKAIERWWTWWQANQERFPSGQWLFHGQTI